MRVQAKKLVTDALRKTGYLAGNATAKASDAQLGLEQLQYLMDSWRLDNLLDISSQEYSAPVAANQATVTIGPGVATDIAMDERPVFIKGAWWLSNTNMVPLAEVKDIELWRSWRNTNITQQYPKYFYYNPSWPVGSIELYPNPGEALTLNIGVEGYPDIPATLDDYIDNPPSWISALMWNLASVLAVDLPIPGGPALDRIDSMAVVTRDRIKRARMRPTPRSVMDLSLLRGRYSSGGTRFGYNVNADSNPGIQ